MSNTSLGNNGMQRATELIVDKKVGGTSLPEYPKTYNFLDTFGNYISITRQQLATLSISAYNNRLAAFKNYVETIETGITIDTTDAYKENLGECPYIR